MRRTVVFNENINHLDLTINLLSLTYIYPADHGFIASLRFEC